MSMDHSFLRQIVRNSAGRIAKFWGSPWKTVPIPRPVLIIPRTAFVAVLGVVMDSCCDAVNSLLSYELRCNLFHM